MVESAPGAKTREMIMVHDAFRREFGLLAELARGVADGDRGRAELVAGHIELMSSVLHHHHHAEDTSIWPRLLERCPEEIAPSVHLMEEQHERIAATITELEAAVAAWRGTGDAAVGTALAEALDRMVPAVLEHLDAEERQVLPLIEKHITAAEWDQMTAEVVGSTPQDKAPVVLGMMMYEGHPQAVQEAVDKLPPDARDFIKEMAPKAYAAYAEQVYGTPNPPHGDVLNG
ncbi:hemerythrin domain-containing protein [Nonomuraea terrae]|uniref:Hemerythrin domain-containing protein n=2 Tax=Nonomuraea terrae TaxID=2530383 RepID=A0A4R4Y8X6_9ACTN|nr:hemerythrin domain-containing protein [Nonomuraea terrae]